MVSSSHIRFYRFKGPRIRLGLAHINIERIIMQILICNNYHIIGIKFKDVHLRKLRGTLYFFNSIDFSVNLLTAINM